MSWPREVGCRSVDTDDSTPSAAFDGISGKPSAVIDVIDLNALIGQDIGLLHERGVDGNGAFIVEIGFRHGGTVNFRFEHKPGTYGALHNSPILTCGSEFYEDGTDGNAHCFVPELGERWLKYGLP